MTDYWQVTLVVLAGACWDLWFIRDKTAKERILCQDHQMLLLACSNA